MKILLLLVAGLFLNAFTYSQVKLPGIFGDHMVIQRDQPVPVWGWASANEKLVVKFRLQIKETTADRNGRWSIKLDPEPAGGPFELSIQASNNIIFHDVMVGEVWLCSGQSNMEFTLKSVRNADTEIERAHYPEIRHIKIPISVSGTPKDDIAPANWNTCTPKTAGDFTAVGYFFAREIVKHLHVAVGLINSTWGGTMVETWTSRGAFEKSAEFKSMIDSMQDKDFESVSKQKRKNLEQQVILLQKNVRDSVTESEWQNPGYNSHDWPEISVSKNWENQSLGLSDLDGIVWYRREVDLDSITSHKPVTLSLGKIDDADETYVNGIKVGSTNNWEANRVYAIAPGVFKTGKNFIAVRVEDTGGGGGFYGDSSVVLLKSENDIIHLSDRWHFRVAKISGSVAGFGPNDYPTLLFNAMIHPLIPYGIRGALWYQGEANAERAYQYRTAFPIMISDWRQHWGQGNFPFYFVQLASFNSDNGDSQHGSAWAELREAQTFTLRIPATGMAVTIDIGESKDIHPKNKQDVGLRLAAIALNNIYGQSMEYSGPVYESMKTEGNKIILDFTHSGSGLMVKDKYGYVRGFEIAGADHHFYYARAFIANNKLTVYNDEVTKPVSVRYAWADDAGDADLYNKEGFPALPFRTDQWKGMTDDKRYLIGKP
jgi:sialate O-acetylesterase